MLFSIASVATVKLNVVTPVTDIKGQFFGACHISATRNSAPKSLKVVVNESIFFSSTMEQLFGAKPLIAEIQPA